MYLPISILSYYCVDEFLDLNDMVADRGEAGRECGKPSPSICLNFCWNASWSVLQETS